MTIYRVKRSVLEIVLNASRRSYPREFGALLKGKINEKDGLTIMVTEALLLPGTIQGDSHAILHLSNLPIGSDCVGSVHSHPSGSKSPSDADLQFFRRTGLIHFICGYPYLGVEDITAYDKDGNRVGVVISETI